MKHEEIVTAKKPSLLSFKFECLKFDNNSEIESRESLVVTRKNKSSVQAIKVLDDEFSRGVV